MYLPHTSEKWVFDPIEAGLGWYEKFNKYQVPGLIYSTLDTRGKPLVITFHLTVYAETRLLLAIMCLNKAC
jgi:hypothetical protein